MNSPVALLLCVGLAACATSDQTANLGPGELEAAAAAFVEHSHAFDYAAMRESATGSFEMIIFGQRLDLDGFEAMLREMESSRDGRRLSSYELEALNTRIIGEVGYTTWESPSFFEGAILVHSDGEWLVDRAFSVRKD